MMPCIQINDASFNILNIKRRLATTTTLVRCLNYDCGWRRGTLDFGVLNFEVYRLILVAVFNAC